MTYIQFSLVFRFSEYSNIFRFQSRTCRLCVVFCVRSSALLVSETRSSVNGARYRHYGFSYMESYLVLAVVIRLPFRTGECWGHWLCVGRCGCICRQWPPGGHGCETCGEQTATDPTPAVAACHPTIIRRNVRCKPSRACGVGLTSACVPAERIPQWIVRFPCLSIILSASNREQWLPTAVTRLTKLDIHP